MTQRPTQFILSRIVAAISIPDCIGELIAEYVQHPIEQEAARSIFSNPRVNYILDRPMRGTYTSMIINHLGIRNRWRISYDNCIRDAGVRSWIDLTENEKARFKKLRRICCRAADDWSVNDSLYQVICMATLNLANEVKRNPTMDEVMVALGGTDIYAAFGC